MDRAARGVLAAARPADGTRNAASARMAQAMSPGVASGRFAAYVSTACGGQP
jgi:hypothetical protein